MIALLVFVVFVGFRRPKWKGQGKQQERSLERFHVGTSFEAGTLGEGRTD
jgi:hypothetical protein